MANSTSPSFCEQSIRLPFCKLHLWGKAQVLQKPTRHTRIPSGHSAGLHVSNGLVGRAGDLVLVNGWARLVAGEDEHLEVSRSRSRSK